MPDDVLDPIVVPGRGTLGAPALIGGKLVLDYEFKNENLSNPDGTMKTQAINCVKVDGPGETIMGELKHALNFANNGKVKVTLEKASLNFEKFAVRVAFNATEPVASRQNLVESDCLPFSMFLDKTTGTNVFNLVVSVGTKNYGWSGTETKFFTTLSLNQWYVADLVYDTDTVAVFIDGNLLSVHAFPDGELMSLPGSDLYIGTWVDGMRNPFKGQIAALQLYKDIPFVLESQLDERRSSAEWFISYKYESIKPTLHFGYPLKKFSYDGDARATVQEYPAGLIMYNETVGVAFEMHGAIMAHYKNRTPQEKQQLGYLVSDEINSKKAGGRKSIFSKGAIYWSPGTGAIHVTGQIYLDYESQGESAFIGFPISAATAVPAGREQIFQGARMYHKQGAPGAFEVHGAILAKFLATGGVATWGYPVTNEIDVKRLNSVIGKSSEFERCTIYWSASTGAFEVHGDIRLHYNQLKGPLGELGFPTSDENNIPGASGAARFNCFQNGSILWFGSFNNSFVCYPFKIYLGRVNSKESEGWGMGQNDLYIRTIIRDNGHEVFRKRFPNSGDYGGHNVKDINYLLEYVVTPNDPNRNIEFEVDVWDSDGGAPFGGGDDHLGRYKKVLNMSNAWGKKENNGSYDTGGFSKINSITWSVKPQININSLSLPQRFWGVNNQGTPVLSYQQYASAFRDVDNTPEDWDPTDWLEKAFYELVTKSIAKNGNCFGMSLEAINAWKYKSHFNLPLDAYKTWNNVVSEFNIKQQYQVGAAPIWWFVGQFLSGNTHNPVDVFNATRNAFYAGDNPVVCVSQQWDFSGKPHCILPFAWDSSTTPWKMSIFDPNKQGVVQTLFVDPVKNEFSYNNGNAYKGGVWSGGRFHYMPYSLLCQTPRTPIWDAILLILAGTIIIVGEDSKTEKFTDSQGIDLDLFGDDTIARQKAGKAVENKFFSFKGFDGTGIMASEMFLRKERQSAIRRILETGRLMETELNRNSSFGEIAMNRNFESMLRPFSASSGRFDKIRDRRIKDVLSDARFIDSLNADEWEALKKIRSNLPVDQDYEHRVKAVKSGQFNYMVKSRLNEFTLQASVKEGETKTVSVQDLGVPSSVVKVKGDKDGSYKLQVSNKLGIGKDRLKITIDRIPAAAGKDLELNIQPGLSGMDIVTNGTPVNATVTVEGTINGKAIKQNYDVPLQGGVRIRPASSLSKGELKVGDIDNLFGQVGNVRHIKAK